MEFFHEKMCILDSGLAGARSAPEKITFFWHRVVTLFENFEGPRRPKMEPKTIFLETFRDAGFEHQFWSIIVSNLTPF